MEIPAIPKMKRPTITLAMIALNEEKNLPRLFKSVEGCFDEIVLVDTGSTDRTKEIALEHGCTVVDFKWVDSFSKARNFAFSHATKDFICWLDCDDVLKNRENFIHWRDHAMGFIDCWFNTYNYALDKNKSDKNPNGAPVVSFVRERVIRRSCEPTWQYDLHEGIVPKPGWSRNFITTWSVDHMRDEEDVKVDRSRNIKLLEKMVKAGPLDPRMQFYYGKELFEAGRPDEAIPALEKALEMQLEHHDRLLALQYGGYSAMLCFDQIKDEFQEKKMSFFNKAIEFASTGVKLEPNRAEFHVLLGDCYLKLNRIDRAVPYFAAAKACLKNFDTPYSDPIYSFRHLYGEGPSVQLSKVYIHLGMLDKCKKEAEECIALYNSAEAKHVLSEVERVIELTRVDGPKEQTEDIVFTCPPQSAYEFDEELYKTKGMGGSETALIEMARLLKEKTGRPVKVFNMRKDTLVADSGVEYIPGNELNAYMSKKAPHVHIAWRHNIKCTNAPTYLWGHDLSTPTVEQRHNFDKFLALSKFHKDYTMGLQGVPADKIIVTRNGISPSKFKFERKAKNPNKIVWMSSPDRGLDRAMLVMDRARERNQDLELHVYYGLDNLRKYGLHDLATKLEGMMAERPWVKYHGFTEQNKMYREVSDAVVWLHPCNFIETFCITALEMLELGIYPVTRRLGALANTLESAEKAGMATVLDHDCVSEQEIALYTAALNDAIENKKWERVSLDAEKHSWSAVADEWAQFMGLTQKAEASAS